MIATYWLLLAILLGVYALALSRVLRHSTGLTPLLGWMIGLGYFLLTPLAILTLRGGYEVPASEGISEEWTRVNLSNPVFFRPYLVVWLAMMLTTLAAALASGRTAAPDGNQSRATVGESPALVTNLSLHKLERVIGIAMALSIIDWAVLIWLVGGFAEFLVSHWYLRSEELSARLGASFTLYTRISLANQLLFTGAAALHTGLGLEQRRPRWKFTALIFVFLLIEMAMSGNRIFIAFYLLAFAASCWIYGRRKLLALLLVASPVLVILFSAWGMVRHDLSKIPDTVAGEGESEISEQTMSSVMHATEGSAVMLLLHMVNDFGGKFDYLHGSTYGRLFTFWLPRSLYPSRPLDFTNQAAIYYLPGEATSLCSTALGEACANFGPAAIAVLPLFTLGVAAYTRYLARRPGGRPLLSAVSFVVLIWFARCTFAENVFNLAAVAALIWLLRLERGLVLLPARSPHAGQPAFGFSPADVPSPVSPLRSSL